MLQYSSGKLFVNCLTLSIPFAIFRLQSGIDQSDGRFKYTHMS